MSKMKLSLLVVSLFFVASVISFIGGESAFADNPANPEYAPDQLVVKLKEGRTLEDIKDLNKKYNVVTTDTVFKGAPTPKEVLDELKNKLSKINTEHTNWYWQLDRNSKEYKDYAVKIAKEKVDLERQIQDQKEILANLEAREKTVPEGTKPVDLSGIYLLKAGTPVFLPLMVRDYTAHPAVEYAEPNYILKAFVTTPNDTRYAEQWALPKIKADLAWDTEKGSVLIAIVDTGVNYNHPDLKDKVIKGLAYLNGTGISSSNDPLDDHGHGSHCAGIAAASTNNNAGVAGVSWNSKILAIKVLNSSGKGYVADIASGIQYAADNGARVISVSIGGSSGSSTLENLVNYVYNKGCVIVIAAGNDNTSNMSYPAAYEKAVAVAATDKNDKKADFSTYGSWVDISAPGVSILSTVLNSNYDFYQGTSMSCPFVSGVMALVISKNPTAANAEIIKKVLDAADNIDNLNSAYQGLLGRGRLNASKALTAGVDSTPPATPVVADEGQTTTNKTQLYASWATDDSESGIAECQYRITQDSTAGTVVRDWTTTGTNKSITAGGLALTVGKAYYFGIKAKNGAGLWSSIGYSDGIQVQETTSTDTTPPVITHTPITQAEKNKAITFEATVTDTGSGVKTVWVSYAQDKTLQLAAAGSNLYRGTLAADQVQTDIAYALKAQDNAGNLTTTQTYTIKVNTSSQTNQPPVAKIEVTPTPAAGRTPLTVQLKGEKSSDPEGGALSYSWNLGNGSTSVSKNTTATYKWFGYWWQYVFNIPKVYTITLTVKDDKDATGSATTTVSVRPRY